MHVLGSVKKIGTFELTDFMTIPARATMGEKNYFHTIKNKSPWKVKLTYYV